MSHVVVNIHERVIPADVDAMGRMIDTLGSAGDMVWPSERWPPMKLDRPLQVGAAGGHGPIRYRVESYEPRRMVRFRFLSPEGFVGTHGFDVEDAGEGAAKLRHVIEMQTVGMAVLKWSLIIRPLHDALLEDALDKVEGAFRDIGPPRAWSCRVEFLRWLVRKSGGNRRYG
ncbi:MAG: SRPBCC family protein [Desulfobacteria bacterium]|nr:SRPBCC family protein [Deltaproteobacteria bacterium]